MKHPDDADCGEDMALLDLRVKPRGIFEAGHFKSLDGECTGGASRVVNAMGIGRALLATAIAASTLGVLTPLAQGPVALATLMVFLPQLIGDGLQTIEGVAEISVIQGVVPDRVLGRVNATLDVLSHGLAYPLGALVAAFVAEQIGVRGAIAVGWAGMALSILFVVFSPVPRLRSAADFLAADRADAAPGRATR